MFQELDSLFQFNEARSPDWAVRLWVTNFKRLLLPLLVLLYDTRWQFVQFQRSVSFTSSMSS